MCGVVGCVDTRLRHKPTQKLLERMAATLVHRGPDSVGYYLEDNVALACRRLSIVDLRTGDQPIYNEDGTVVMVCNGEIFNHQALRRELRDAGHTFRTATDVEVLVHLYEDLGAELVHRLNGQFAFAIYDKRSKQLFLARDHVGITPLHYALVDGVVVFASEIKAILAHPLVPAEVDLTGLDQVLSLPGLVSPRTMFKGISSLPPGHLLLVSGTDLSMRQYWDLDYPRLDQPAAPQDEAEVAERLEQSITAAVARRLHGDVPHGYYVSGGLDSSLIATMGVSLEPHARPRSFSLAFADDDISEHPYQRLMAAKLNAEHTEVLASPDEIADWLPEVIYHCECPIRESYNSASLLLSQAVHRDGMKVVLTGEGADELFAGYLGYKFDKMREHSRGKDRVWLSEEDQLRLRLWGNPNLVYERDFIAFALVKRRLYAKQLAAQLDSFAFVNHPLVNKERLEGRHILHQRSYLDFKLRLSDHLLGDHGDRMALANSVEARYPFLDLELIECARGVPPDLKLREFDEKYVLKRIASGRLPAEIVDREKFAFRAPTSPRLLRLRREWLEELLAPKRIAREGYFNPETVQRLRQQYAGDDFEVDLMFADDLLMVIITFGLFLEVFRLPSIA